MKRLIPTLVSILLLAGLGVYVWKYESTPKSTEQPREHLYDATAGEVVRYTTEDTEKQRSMTVEKQADGSWWITAPGRYEADPDAAAAMAMHIAKPEIERKLDPQTDLTPYGLDKPKFKASCVLKDGKKKAILIGAKNPTGSGYFGMEEGGKDLVTFAAWSTEQIKKTLIDLRSKTLMKLEPAEVSRIELVRKRERLEFKREGADAWRMTAPLDTPADRYTVDALLGDLKGLRGIEIVETPSAYSKYKLDQPAAVITLYTGTGTGQKVTLSKPNPAADEAYATSTRLPFVIKLGSALAVGNATKPLEEFRDRLLLQSGKEDLTSVRIAEGALDIVAAKDEKGKWSVTKPAGAQGGTELDDMLFEVVYIRAERFADDAPKGLGKYGLEPARLAVTVAGAKDKKPFTSSYRLGTRTGDRVFLK
ncbi:MAG: DUF4340 domain-containing protein, partial [bacterium]